MQSEVDKPVYGSSYVCPGPGGYKLQRGHLLPFPRACAPPTMLVRCTPSPRRKYISLNVPRQNVTAYGM